MNGNDEVAAVSNFGTGMGAVVFLKEGPDGALWYIRYETNAIRKVSPIGTTNLPPVASAQQSVLYGPSALQVNFTSTGSHDPENGVITYLWNFGDGFTSPSASPTHTYTVLGGAPTSYTVTLTVTDDQGLVNSTTLLVNVNNTPPTVAITGFPNGHQYPVGADTSYALQASVSDLEPGPLTYAWQTILHHNTHVHPGPILTSASSSAVISGEGCYGETFYYEVKLTVTDAGGLGTTATKFLYPRCSSIAPTAVINSTVNYGSGPFIATLDGSASVDNGNIVSYAWDFGDGTSATGDAVSKTFSDPGDYYVRLMVTDNDGLVGTATKVINVLTYDPPQCVGASGSILREYWNYIIGANVVDLTSNANYPNAPNGSSFPSQFSGPSNFDDNYGTRMRGYIIAPETGTYYFTVTSTDASVLYLSLNADPKYKQAICSVPGFTGQNELNKYPTQRSAAVTLQQGVYYYADFIQKGATGSGDNLAVRWERPTNPTPTIIPGSSLARWLDCAPSVSLRAALQGPFDAQTGLMRDDLRSALLIPSSEPFTTMGFTQAGGGGGEIVPASMLNTTGKNAIVDWVLVELRNKTTPTNIVATRGALLQRDGDIVGTDGHARLLFNVASDNYYIAVRHRNHLGAMTATAIAMSKNEIAIDFTQGATNTFGSAARATLGNGSACLWSGNVFRDTQIKYTGTNNDRDPILVAIGGTVPTNTVTTYSKSDVNLDGVVKYTGANNDRDPILQNIGGTTPTSTRTEQLP